MNRHIAIISLAVLALSAPVSADVYSFYFPNSSEDSNNDGIPDALADRKVKIINSSTYTAFDGDLSGYYGADFSDLENHMETSTGNGWEVTKDPMGSPTQVLDFIDNTLVLRNGGLIQVNPDAPGEVGWTYDVVTRTNVKTGQLESKILIAATQEAFDAAEEAGYTVMLASSEIERSGDYKTLTTFSRNLTNDESDSANVQSDGGLISERIESSNGAVLFRQEDDGTVHIGENSIVLADELVSNSGFDQIYSSSGVLEFGNNASHRTVIRGSLEVPNPTRPEQAANKRYADSVGAMSMALAMMPKAAPGTTMATAGVGSLGGQQAVAIGISGQTDKYKFSYNVGASYNSTVGETGVGGGIGWQF